MLRVQKNPWNRAFLQGVTPAVLGAIATNTIPPLKTALTHPHPFHSAAVGVIGFIALLVLIRYKLPTWVLVPLGASLGLLAGQISIKMNAF